MIVLWYSYYKNGVCIVAGDSIYKLEGVHREHLPRAECSRVWSLDLDPGSGTMLAVSTNLTRKNTA